ncbi:protein kinase domain-containing protein [Tundrisphaera sp. TA3]|uniref:serine/threonine-protein kinase n=1 Tax=Tundrisphaera sp. TA3 TaxID=3435775 RepID=UPI003EBC2095
MPERATVPTLMANFEPDQEPSVETLAEGLAIAMAEDWRIGLRRSVEDVLADSPDLRDEPRVVLRLIYEEICLRQEEGPKSLSVEMLGRFPAHRDELQMLLTAHRVLDDEAPAAAFPEVGGTLGDARLLSELGRGALGRVFLATQFALADRPIVLKVIPLRGVEHLTLARLQHTYIVPLYAAPVFPELGLRALFMPYLGSLTLARLSTALGPIPPGARTGADLLEVLDRSREAQPVDLPGSGSARAWLARASYAQAVAWIGTCLGQALLHAHERGLVHLDLKPSNVLIAADGQPMLLDFHLARAPVQADDPSPGSIGGTPTYMSPEQADALVRIRQGLPPRSAVDARSDIYSLGVLLFEMLGGTLPPPAESRDIARQLRRANRQVSSSLAELIARAMAIDPRDRYPDASALVEDLRRYLADLPLRGVSDRDPIERWRRWRRRRPHALALMMMGLAVALATLLTLIATRGPGLTPMDIESYHQSRLKHRQEDAEHLALAVASLRDQDRITSSAPRNKEADGVLADLAHDLWRERKKFLDTRDGTLADVVEQGIREDLRELAILSIALDARARPSEVSANRRQGLRRLNEARAEVGSSPELERVRTQLLATPVPDGIRN